MKNVLKREKDFNYVFTKGKRVGCRTLTMVYAKSNELKVGYCVSKKHGKAVKRNYVKRVLRSAFHEYSKTLGDYYIAFIPKIRDTYCLKEISKDMQYLFSKENLFK